MKSRKAQVTRRQAEKAEDLRPDEQEGISFFGLRSPFATCGRFAEKDL